MFSLIQHIRIRAAQLPHYDSPPPPEDADAEREALTIAARVQLRLPALVERFELSPLGRKAWVCLVAVENDPFLRTRMRATTMKPGGPGWNSERWPSCSSCRRAGG